MAGARGQDDGRGVEQLVAPPGRRRSVPLTRACFPCSQPSTLTLRWRPRPYPPTERSTPPATVRLSRPMRLYNTLSRRKEELVPLEPGRVTLYSCGPTVYRYAHIGNLRTYIFADLLCRVLEYLGHDVTQVMNFTDVGHLTDDRLDQGEDKMLVSARRENK